MFQDSIYKNRILKLKEKLNPNTLYLVSNPSHIKYLTGFEFLVPNEREAFFICDKNISTLVHSSFSPICNFNFISYLSGTFPSQLKSHLEKIIQKTGCYQIYFDDKTLFVNELNEISSIPQIQTKVFPTDFVSDQMIIKEPEEIVLIKKACKISKEVFNEVRKQIKQGITELEISELIQEAFKKNGVGELAFPSIVAFGANSAMPHHQPSNKKLKNNDVILIDMGAKYKNYCADMTRTFWFGDKPSEQFKNIEKIVLDAYNKSLQITKEHSSKKTLSRDIDNAARTHIINQGFGDNFIHTTGHGLGLDIHEYPSLNWSNTAKIYNNMTITIEPGIYLEGKFGYRYENTILTTKKGAQELTK